MEDVAHGEDVDLRQIVSEEVAGDEAQPPLQTVVLDVLLERGCDLWEVVANAGEMRVRERDLHCAISLRCPDVSECRMVLPREPRCDCEVGPVAEPGHRREELLQPGRIRVERLEERCVPRLCLVLKLPGSQRLRELTPEPV